MTPTDCTLAHRLKWWIKLRLIRVRPPFWLVDRIVSRVLPGHAVYERRLELSIRERLASTGMAHSEACCKVMRLRGVIADQTQAREEFLVLIGEIVADLRGREEFKLADRLVRRREAYLKRWGQHRDDMP